MQILVPFSPHIKGGGVITVIADYPGQALFWDLVSYDPVTGEGPPMGSLRWPVTRADKAGLSVNIYLAPTDPALAGKNDRIRVRAADA